MFHIIWNRNDAYYSKRRHKRVWFDDTDLLRLTQPLNRFKISLILKTVPSKAWNKGDYSCHLRGRHIFFLWLILGPWKVTVIQWHLKCLNPESRTLGAIRRNNCSPGGHLLWLQTPLELFFLPPLESLIAHRHCNLKSVGVVDTHIYEADTHTCTH